jgi:hypothetical protein
VHCRGGWQNFNFRFPDTRRLPMIFETLTRQQQREFIGTTIGWHYIGRDGSWSSLPLEPSANLLSIPHTTTLDARQFGKLIEDSEPDEIWVQLLDRGVHTHLLPSQRHALISTALQVADKSRLDDMLKIAWCIECIQASCQSNPDTLQTRLTNWKEENARNENETLHLPA